MNKRETHDPLCRLFDPRRGGSCECATITRVRLAVLREPGYLSATAAVGDLKRAREHIDAALRAIDQHARQPDEAGAARGEEGG